MAKKTKFKMHPAIIIIAIFSVIALVGSFTGYIDIMGLLPGSVLSVSSVNYAEGDQTFKVLLAVDDYDKLYGIKKEEINNALSGQFLEATKEVQILIQPAENSCQISLQDTQAQFFGFPAWTYYVPAGSWECQSKFFVTVTKATDGVENYIGLQGTETFPTKTIDGTINTVNLAQGVTLQNVGNIKGKIYESDPDKLFAVVPDGSSGFELVNRNSYTSKVSNIGNLCLSNPLGCANTLLNATQPYLGFDSCANFSSCSQGDGFVNISGGFVKYNRRTTTDKALITIEFDKEFFDLVTVEKPKALPSIVSMSEFEVKEDFSIPYSVTVKNIGEGSGIIQIFPSSDHGFFQTDKSVFDSPVLSANESYTFNFTISGWQEGNDKICIKASTINGEVQNCKNGFITPTTKRTLVELGGKDEAKPEGDVTPTIEEIDPGSKDAAKDKEIIDCKDGYVPKIVTDKFWIWEDRESTCVKPFPTNTVIILIVLGILSVGTYVIGKRQKWWK